MRRFLTTVLVLEALVCGAAFAQIDPDPESIGVYFDLDAMTYCCNEPDMGYFDAYVMVTNPTAQVAGIEFRLSMTVDGVEEIPELIFEGVPLDIGIEGDHVCGFQGFLPFSPVVHVATHSGSTFDNVVRYYLTPIVYHVPSVPNSMCYVDAEDWGRKIVLNPSSGSFDLPVAVHGLENCDFVPAEEETWGGVKQLYR